MTKFAFVSAERGNHAVSALCRVVGASVSGFYAWLHAIPAVQGRAEAEAELRGHVFAARRRVYGSPRVHAELRREGRRHSRRRVERLMREMGLSARRGRPSSLSSTASPSISSGSVISILWPGCTRAVMRRATCRSAMFVVVPGSGFISFPPISDRCQGPTRFTPMS